MDASCRLSRRLVALLLMGALIAVSSCGGEESEPAAPEPVAEAAAEPSPVAPAAPDAPLETTPLINSGFSTKQTAFLVGLVSGLATEDDLQRLETRMTASREVEHRNLQLELKADLATHETGMTRWIVGTGIASVGVILAAIGVFVSVFRRRASREPLSH